MLRCFGPMITKLFFTNYEDPKCNGRIILSSYCRRIMRYIYEFCVMSLIQMVTSTRCLSFRKNPFPNVEELTIHQLQINFKLKGLNKIYPKLRRLHIDYTSSDFSSFITETFSNLQHLDVHLFSAPDTCITATAQALHLNPQLKSLKIGLKDFSFLQDIGDKLQSLEILDIYLFGSNLQTNLNPIHFKNVTFFQLKIIPYSGIRTQIPTIPTYFDKLKEFRFLGSDCSFVCSSIRMFLNAHSTIEKLTLSCRDSRNLPKLTEIVEKLSSLRELIMGNGEFNIENMIWHLENSFKSLRRLTCYFLSRTNDQRPLIDQIREVCSNKWNVSNLYYIRTQ